MVAGVIYLNLLPANLQPSANEEIPMKPWYEKLFANYARTYDTEGFTQGTLQEVGFIEREIRQNQNNSASSGVLMKLGYTFALI
jgi:hypothetical protein